MNQTGLPLLQQSTRSSSGLARWLRCALLTVGWVAIWAISSPAVVQDYGQERSEMVRTIVLRAQELGPALLGKDIDPKVLEALRLVPRHEFVPAALRADSYADRPLPIGYGQTISQPLIVALMTHLLEPGPSSVVLEVGTGSGYQAAVLAPLVRKVYSIEIIPALAESAAKRVSWLGYANVSVQQGDGYYGLPQAAPFDGIIVTAAAGHIPPPLLQQLKPGGRMVIPIGPPLGQQHLTVVERNPEGRVRTRRVMFVRFVPLTGQR
jgi:protein-L-isoaspartate(D-aspartate) O-methyltransferase